jgi:hypothetical protein
MPWERASPRGRAHSTALGALGCSDFFATGETSTPNRWPSPCCPLFRSKSLSSLQDTLDEILNRMPDFKHIIAIAVKRPS